MMTFTYSDDTPRAANGLPQALSHISADVVNRAKHIKLLATDVDGVLTDGGIIWDAATTETKAFNVKDGWAIKAVQALGLKTAIITGRGSHIVEHRGTELGFDYIYQSVKDKETVLEEIMQALGITEAEVAYMGDDIPDIGVLGRVGLSGCPADAVFEVKPVCHYVTQAPGGKGAMREFLDIIRYAQT
jgi:3-deoxy-D-manno-octulosonate 8-phosphate phosphatase (KDO 8-P phosphatase)